MVQIGDASRAASAALETGGALHRLHVMEAPLLEPVPDVDQLLGELVKLPVGLQIAVDGVLGRVHAAANSLNKFTDVESVTATSPSVAPIRRATLLPTRCGWPIQSSLVQPRSW